MVFVADTYTWFILTPWCDELARRISGMTVEGEVAEDRGRIPEAEDRQGGWMGYSKQAIGGVDTGNRLKVWTYARPHLFIDCCFTVCLFFYIIIFHSWSRPQNYFNSEILSLVLIAMNSQLTVVVNLWNIL